MFGDSILQLIHSFSAPKVSELNPSSESMAETMLKEDVVCKATGLQVKKVHRRISWEEVNERWFKGLCMFCNELETPDHCLQHKNLGILITDCDEEQSSNDSELVEIVVATESIETEQGTVKREANASMILEVEGDVEKGQEVQSMEKICSAHQVFDKMSLGVQSKRRHIKCLKSWRFKFKQRKQQRGKPQIAHRLIYKGILMIDSEDHLSSSMVKEIGIEISSDRWLSNSIGCELEIGETVNDEYRVPSDSDLIMNDIEKDKERLKWKKRRKSLKTWRFKFKSRDMRGHNLCRVTLLLKNSLVITGSWRRSMMNNYEPVLILSELERKKKKLCLKTWMFKYKNVEFLKRMEAGSSMIMVLYNNTELINYLYPLEKSCLVSIIRIENALIEARFVKTMEEYSKNPLASTLAYELFHSPRPPELFVADRMIATKVEMEEDMNKDDQKPQGDWGHYCLLVAAANWSPQMNLWSTSYHVWHRWKARYCFVGIISTMWAWLFGEGGFDIGKEMTRGGSGLKKDQWLR